MRKFDRGWTERPVFGKVRCMMSHRTEKKVKTREYITRFGPGLPSRRWAPRSGCRPDGTCDRAQTAVHILHEVFTHGQTARGGIGVPSGFTRPLQRRRMRVSPSSRRWSEHLRLLPVCPEVGIGLGTPRPTIRLSKGENGVRLIEPRSGKDLTDAMVAWATEQRMTWPVWASTALC